MTHILTILFAFFLLLWFGACSAPPAPSGYGSCYEVQPLCQYPTHPFCACNARNYCQWICTQ